ncbi:MAG: Chemotaxis protein methyltransferase CheR [Myxococcaceae bacterium]|nr:Chemotaxis protein methyltransferase CheR [Myxococcaceae bacterium]
MQRDVEQGEFPRAVVWIVDDSALEGELAARTLAARFDVELFRDGHSMLERLSSRRAPDTLVLDWLLPDTSGVDVCRFLRANESTASLPVLVLSVRGEMSDVLEGLTAGADDYLVKPFHSGELVARVTALVRTRQHLERAERAERAFRSLLEHLPDLVVALDRGGRVTFVNAEAARVLGARRERLLGVAAAEVLPGFVVGEGDAPLADARADYPIGDRVYAPFARAIPTSELASTVVVLRDVTLDRAAADAARRADQRKDEFLAMLGHELRNPLSAIATALHLTSLRPDDPRVNARARDVLVRQTAHMTRMIDDLLDVSRITRGKIQLRRGPLDLAATLERALETARPALNARHQRVEVAIADAPLGVDGDPTRLEQVLVNLLQNAAKYTPDGGRVWVSAGREGDEVVARVRDDGVGIPAEALPQIFDLFSQVESSLERAQGGLGIGLTLVRTIVAMHGGSVAARSEGAGRGSEFVVRLPYARGAITPVPPVRTAVSERPPPSPDAPPMRVLVVDDNEDIADLMVVALGVAGYAVTLARDGLAALDEAARVHPAAVVLDLGLPGIDGFEVARRLRADPEQAGVLIIAVSGYGQAGDLVRSGEVGVDHHFVKPVDFELLHAVLDGRRRSLQ